MTRRSAAREDDQALGELEARTLELPAGLEVDPEVVVPTHYDNFFRPLGQRMEFVSNVQLSQLPVEIGAVSRDARLAALPRADL